MRLFLKNKLEVKFTALIIVFLSIFNYINYQYLKAENVFIPDNLVIMKNMGKAGQTAIDPNSVKRDGDMVYFDLYIINRSIDKDISYIFHKYQMNCINGNWKIIQMYHMMKNGNKANLKFARYAPFPPDQNSSVYQNFVCKQINK